MQQTNSGHSGNNPLDDLLTLVYNVVGNGRFNVVPYQYKNDVERVLVKKCEQNAKVADAWTEILVREQAHETIRACLIDVLIRTADKGNEASVKRAARAANAVVSSKNSDVRLSLADMQEMALELGPVLHAVFEKLAKDPHADVAESAQDALTDWTDEHPSWL